MDNYYIIVFQNVKTGENKEYYEFLTSGKNIRDIAIELVDKFGLDKEITRLHIYQLKEVIYDDEY